MCFPYLLFIPEPHLSKMVMHTLIYLLITLLWPPGMQTQDCVIRQGKAYQRATIPGNIPRKDLDEAGKQIEAPVKKMNTFFIYIQVEKKCNLEVIRLWIDKKAYRTIQEEVLHTPVLIPPSQPGGKFDTLVKKTKHKVFRIHPREEWDLRPSKEVADRLGRAKIVIEYANKSGTGHYAIKDIKRIAPMVLQ